MISECTKHRNSTSDCVVVFEGVPSGCPVCNLVKYHKDEMAAREDELKTVREDNLGLKQDNNNLKEQLEAAGKNRIIALRTISPA